VHDEDNSALSVAVQFTIVATPEANNEPEAGRQLTVAMPEPSDAVGAKVTLAVVALPVGGMFVILAGQLMVGFLVSTYKNRSELVNQTPRQTKLKRTLIAFNVLK
jgi:hypothetical protein